MSTFLMFLFIIQDPLILVIILMHSVWKLTGML